MLSRRKFIGYTVLSTSAVAAGFFSQSTDASTFENTIVKLLSHDLNGLKVKKTDLQKYAKEAAQSMYQRFNFAGVQLLCLYHLNPIKSLPLPFSKKYNQMRTEIVGSFLLSTDFFYNKMDESKQITFSGIAYNPYKNACGNPFSGLSY